MTDENIITRILEHNETQYFEIIYDRYSKHIYNKCFSFVKNEDEAKDLTQDIFLKLYLKLSSFKGKSKFSTWVYSFTYNYCINYVNRNAKRKYEMRLNENFDIQNYGETIDSSESLQLKAEEELVKAIKKLPIKDRIILELKYQKNLTIKAIETELGLGASAVKMRIKRAKARLAENYVAAV
ncbi:RNA polymerase sigma-70 factor [Tamlana sedimentorum]|uniref:RNA polymerase sigma-70 factor n=2 Tax=Neotamlana sedimentorum TaxID=1435349 RepID=A0A0D7WAV9_9FLAO|nr:RNA polymerase sigma-70 factor [Tamlana sedimentorum]